MKDITFIHCGDIHFDIPFTSLSSCAGLPKKRREAIKKAFIKLIDHVKEQQPDFLFIAGDLFEHEYTTYKTILWINELFCLVPKTEVILIAGNHDPEAANSFYKTMKWNSNVHFLGIDKQQQYFENLETNIFGVGFGAGHGLKTTINDMECETSINNVLLFHGDIDLEIGDRDYNAISSSVLDTKGFDYVAVSHNHKYRNDFGSKGSIQNAGSLEALGFDEIGQHGYIKGKISNHKLSTQFVSLSESPYIIIILAMTDISDEKTLLSKIREKIANSDFLYKIELIGKRQADVIIDYKRVEQILKNEVTFLRIKDSSKISENKDNNVTGLKAIFIDEINKLLLESDEEQQVILQQALVYGLEAIEDEKVELSIEDVT